MTEAELNAQVEAELVAQVERELEAEMNRKRVEIAARLRREAEMRDYDRINARHPIEGPATRCWKPSVARTWMRGRRRINEWMDRVNSRPIEGGFARGGAASIGRAMRALR